MRTRRPAELEALSALSAYIGRDPLLTQASAGDTSLKFGGRLWIKASGKWLSDALQDDIFLSLELSEARNCVRKHHTIEAPRIDSSGEELRPSVEAPMHAVLPQRVIVHLHSANTLALAREIERALGSSSRCDVWILGNHGLVVCGDTCEAVESLLKQVEMRIGAIPRRAPQYDHNFLLRLAEGSRWRLPEHTRLHCLATDDTSRSILARGILYPCQAIFLGGSHPWRPFYSGLYSEAVRHPEQGLSNRAFLIFKDKGVLLSKNITRVELETLIGLAEVVQRLGADAPIRYLTEAECDHISLHYSYRSPATPDHIALSA